MVHINLQAAFYNGPLPPQLSDVTAFRFQNRTFVFNVLPMGLYISPAILQAIVQEAVRSVVPRPYRMDGTFAWVHLDDIIIAANCQDKLHVALCNIICNLDRLGFFIALEKLILKPMCKLNYCGLAFNMETAKFNSLYIKADLF